jgi:lipoprotein-anchoring transpeptidase ErfK/SrfK
MTQAGPLPAPPGIRRGVAVSAMAVLTAAGGCALAAPAQAASSRVPATQPLVVLLQDHVVRSAPDEHARRIESVRARRPLTRVRTILPVLDRATSDSGQPWAQVRLPGRPSGHTGWILTSHTRRASTAWHIAVKLSTRRVSVYSHGRVVRRFSAVVGKRATPTPHGRFFIEEGLALSSHAAGGPFALATSARSSVLQHFEGGPGQIAIHGTRNLSGAPGTAASHGCIRVTTSAVTWLARRIGAGVPLTISR